MEYNYVFLFPSSNCGKMSFNALPWIQSLVNIVSQGRGMEPPSWIQKAATNRGSTLPWFMALSLLHQIWCVGSEQPFASIQLRLASSKALLKQVCLEIVYWDIILTGLLFRTPSGSSSETTILQQPPSGDGSLVHPCGSFGSLVLAGLPCFLRHYRRNRANPKGCSPGNWKSLLP